MITRSSFIVVLGLFLQSCIFPQEPVVSDMDFFDHINSYNIFINGFFETKNYKDYDESLGVPYIQCEFFTEYIGKGTGCFFAILKREYGIWKKEKGKDLYGSTRVNQREMAEDLLFHRRDTLAEHFDLYVFYVRQEDLVIEGGNTRDDGTDVPDYHAKDDATVYTYKYEEGKWIEKKKNNIGGTNPRGFGEKCMDEKLRRRFF